MKWEKKKIKNRVEKDDKDRWKAERNEQIKEWKQWTKGRKNMKGWNTRNKEFLKGEIWGGKTSWKKTKQAGQNRGRTKYNEENNQRTGGKRRNWHYEMNKERKKRAIINTKLTIKRKNKQRKEGRKKELNRQEQLNKWNKLCQYLQAGRQTGYYPSELLQATNLLIIWW